MDNYSNHTEQQLFEQVAAGDREAFSALFTQHFQSLYLSLLKYTKSPSDAEDIVQQAFVRLWEQRSSLKDIENPLGWLYTITRNEFRDRYRKLVVSQRYRQHLKEVFEEETGTPEETLIYKQQDSLLRRAIAGLPGRQREAYLLSREGGLTYAEIATKMGLERSSVKEHISRAIKSIQAFLLAYRDPLFIGGIIFFKWLSPW